MKAHYYTNLVEDDRTIQKDVLIEESALNEVVRYLKSNLMARAKTIQERLQSVRNDSTFEITALFLSKSAAISKLESFLTEWSCPYFVFALGDKLAFLELLFCPAKLFLC